MLNMLACRPIGHLCPNTELFARKLRLSTATLNERWRASLLRPATPKTSFLMIRTLSRVSFCYHSCFSQNFPVWVAGKVVLWLLWYSAILFNTFDGFLWKINFFFISTWLSVASGWGYVWAQCFFSCSHILVHSMSVWSDHCHWSWDITLTYGTGFCPVHFIAACGLGRCRISPPGWVL